MGRTAGSIVFAVLVATGCAQHAAPAPSPLDVSPGAHAIMRDDGAWFMFPAEDSLLRLNAPGAIHPGPAGAPEHGWKVIWETADSLRCTAPYGISLWTTKQSGPERDTALVAAVRGQRPEVLTPACQYTTPLATATLDADVMAAVTEGRMVLRVRGTAAMQRLFLGQRPAWVRFFRQRNEGPVDRQSSEWMVSTESGS